MSVRGALPPRADAAFATSLAVVLLGPVLLERGSALTGDMVFVPHQPWKDAWLGLDGSVARFVPGDAFLSVATMALPGDLVQKVTLFAALVLGGCGAAKLVEDRVLVGRLAAVVLFCWNPWVFERLSIGQWGAVVGYMSLPYVVMAAARFRADARGGWPPLLLVLAFASLWSPAASLMAALTAVCVVLMGRRLRPTLVALLLSGMSALPWLAPSLVTAPGLLWPGEQFEAFVARGESGAGLVASLASLGGIWKESVVPGERTVALVVVASCATTALALYFAVRSRPRLDEEGRRTLDGLFLLAVLSLTVALVPAVPGLTSAFDQAAEHWAAIGLVRDSHRFLGPAVLVLLPGIAAVTSTVWDRAASGPGALRAVAILVAVWPVVCLPSMAWGLGGQLRPVEYPDEWRTAAAVLHEDEMRSGGSTVVLPWSGGYRGFDWNHDRASLDPAPRYFAGDVLIDDRILLGDQALGNESPRLAAVTDALGEPDPASSLHELGVSRVLVEKTGGVREGDVPQGTVLHDGSDLTVISLGRVDEVPGPSQMRRLVVVGADLILLAFCGFAAWTNWRRRGVR